MEKRSPHYPLKGYQAEFTSPSALRITGSALQGAALLGITRALIVKVVQGMNRSHFYKSMPSHGNPEIWQDVYRVPHGPLTLYVKLTLDDKRKRLLISLKEK